MLNLHLLLACVQTLRKAAERVENISTWIGKWNKAAHSQTRRCSSQHLLVSPKSEVPKCLKQIDLYIPGTKKSNINTSWRINKFSPSHLILPPQLHGPPPKLVFICLWWRLRVTTTLTQPYISFAQNSTSCREMGCLHTELIVVADVSCMNMGDLCSGPMRTTFRGYINKNTRHCCNNSNVTGLLTYLVCVCVCDFFVFLLIFYFFLRWMTDAYLQW